MISREKAEEILKKYISDEYHLYHAHMVALAMEMYAEGERLDKDKYYITGLLHDIDYGENYNIDKHGSLSEQMLKDEGVEDAEILHAIKAHVPHRTGVEPQSNLDFALIACDEISGIAYAYSKIRPEGFHGMKAKSLKKKFNDPKFAAKIDRSLILRGIEGINTELTDHMKLLITAYQEI